MEKALINKIINFSNVDGPGNRMAIFFNCNKLALGHHFDDAVQTFFMNLFYGGKIGCFSPMSYLSRKDLYLIRPMVFCEESKVESAAQRYHLPVVKSECPVDGHTCRQSTQELIKDLEKQFPDLRRKVMGALQRAEISMAGENTNNFYLVLTS